MSGSGSSVKWMDLGAVQHEWIWEQCNMSGSGGSAT